MPFPLAPPSGMRDLLPPEAARRARLTSKLTRHFGGWGYALVTTPPFEHAEVIERGLDTLDRRDLLRFVEPSSGEVALLRPDITPQIARIVATRLADRPAPYRLSYAGSLIRQRRGRARTQRQSMQAGVELVGVPGIEADIEAIELASTSLEAAGLHRFTVELSLVSLARGALAEVPDGQRGPAERALMHKDTAELDRLLARAGVDRAVAARLRGVAELYGDADPVIRRARALFTGDREKAGLARLAKIVRRLKGRLSVPLSVDLGEVRGASYYTGASFRLLAPGPGEPVGAGGRYDGLLARFGLPAPATGFGIDVGHLEWALRTAGQPLEGRDEARVVVAGGTATAREQHAARLRHAGVQAGVLHSGGRAAALDYARAWEYDAAVVVRGNDAVAVRVDGAQRDLPIKVNRAFVRWVMGSKAHDNEG